MRGENREEWGVMQDDQVFEKFDLVSAPVHLGHRPERRRPPHISLSRCLRKKTSVDLPAVCRHTLAVRGLHVAGSIHLPRQLRGRPG